MVFKCGYLRIMRLSSFIISAFCIPIKAFFARKCHVLLKLSTPKRLLNVLVSNMNKKMVFFQCIMKKGNFIFTLNKYFYIITNLIFTTNGLIYLLFRRYYNRPKAISKYSVPKGRCRP